MGTPYTPAANQLGTITVPADTDPRNAAVFNVPMQAIADGVAFVGAQNNPLSGLAALAAITTPADGTVRYVVGFGDYVFKTSATTGLSPFRVAAADATVGGWVAGVAYETSLVRQVPLGLAVRGISGSSPTPGVINPITTAIPFIPIGYADAQLDTSSLTTVRIYTGTPQTYAYLADIHSQLVDGATLTSATLRFKPKTGHGALPTAQPGYAVCRSPLAAVGAPTNLLSTGNGFSFLAAGTLVAYEVDQALFFVPNQNNVIDKTAFRYWAVLVDEAGTNALAGTAYHALTLNLSIPDARRS